MQMELNREEAELLRDLLHHEVEELDKEINRTDSLRFKRGLRDTDRTMETILGRITALLRAPALVAVLAAASLLISGCARADDPSPGQWTDASITAAVKAELAMEAFTPSLHIGVATKDRVVTLTGKVKSHEDEQTAVRVARAVGGVRSVDDQLAIHQNF
jgi:hyperosmotically inducible protein